MNKRVIEDITCPSCLPQPPLRWSSNEATEFKSEVRSHFDQHPLTTTGQHRDRTITEPTGSDHTRRRPSDTPMCSSGAYRSAAQSQLSWPILTESNPNNHVHDSSACDSEFEIEAHPSSIQPTLVQLNPRSRSDPR